MNIIRAKKIRMTLPKTKRDVKIKKTKDGDTKDWARSSSGRNTHLDHLETEVSEVTSLLKDNVEKVLERGERIDNLQSRSEDLESSSSHFRSQSVRLRKKMWWKNCKMMCIIGIVIFVILAVVIVVILVETKPWESSSGGGHNKTLTDGSTSGLMTTTPLLRTNPA